jgi:hypothetical protein
MSDIETCYKAFRSGVIKPLALTSRGFGLEMAMFYIVYYNLIKAWFPSTRTYISQVNASLAGSSTS